MHAPSPVAHLADADWAELRAAAAAASFDRHQLNARLKDLGIAKLGHRLVVLNQLRVPGGEAATEALGGEAATEVLGGEAAATGALGDEAAATGALSDATATGASAAPSASPAPAAASASAAASPWPRRFEVVHSPFVYVREGRSEHAHRLGYRWKGEAVTCVGEEEGWVELAEGEGYMLRHGGHLGLGLGALLRPLEAESAAQPAPALDATERTMRQLIERQFPRHTPRPDARLSCEPDAVARSVAQGLRKTNEALRGAGLPRCFSERTAIEVAVEAAAAAVDVAEVTGVEVEAVEVAEVEAAELTAERFAREFVARNAPLVVRGALRDWPPLKRWGAAALRRRAGTRAVPVRVRAEAATGESGEGGGGGGESGEGGEGGEGGEEGGAAIFGDVMRMQAYSTESTSLAQLLDELAKPRPRWYGARLPVAELLPELLEDVAGAEASQAMPARLAAACFGPAQRSNPVCYVGAGGQATPLHFDPYENLLCVVEGAKHLSLFHPADAPLLSPAGERNTACVYSRVDVSTAAAASRQHGAFARAQPHVATVRRGDLLYLPLGWWHAVRGSQECNISVNFWFDLHPSKRDDEACSEGGGAAGAL